MVIKLIRLTAFLLVIMIFMPGPINAETYSVEEAQESGSNKLLVKFYPEATDEEKASIREDLGAGLIKRLNEISAEVWALPDGLSIEDAVIRLQGEKAVECSEPDYKYRPQSAPGGDSSNSRTYIGNPTRKKVGIHSGI